LAVLPELGIAALIIDFAGIDTYHILKYTYYGGWQMATTKLTLTVKPDIVRMAKLYASKHRTSVSATFSRLIRALVAAEQNRVVNAPKGSTLETIAGILKLPEGKTTDDLRMEALIEKYELKEEMKGAR
jgi:hypothetical protein